MFPVPQQPCHQHLGYDLPQAPCGQVTQQDVPRHFCLQRNPPANTQKAREEPLFCEATKHVSQLQHRGKESHQVTQKEATLITV